MKSNNNNYDKKKINLTTFDFLKIEEINMKITQFFARLGNFHFLLKVGPLCVDLRHRGPSLGVFISIYNKKLFRLQLKEINFMCRKDDS